MIRARPERTVSTSGSSGTDPADDGGGLLGVGEGVERGGGSLLLGLLLVEAAARPVPLLAQNRVRLEPLVVVGARFADLVAGDALGKRGGELLKAGLPVESGTERRRVLDNRVEQCMDELPRGADAVLEEDRPDHGLQGVGEDRRLVTTCLLYTSDAADEEDSVD